MDLKHFITESLYQIVGGIHAAQEKIEEFDCEIQSKFINMTSERDNEFHDVYFDIALTVVEGEPPTSKLLVMGLSHFGSGSYEQLLSIVSRVKFSVPLSFPARNKLSYVPFNTH